MFVLSSVRLRDNRGVVPALTVGQKDTSLWLSVLIDMRAIIVIRGFTLNNYNHGKVLYFSRLATGLLSKQLI